MGIVANKYEPKDIFRFMREWSELTQGEFGKTINRSRDGVQKIESGKRGYNMQTFLDVANKHGIEIILEKKHKK